MRHVQLSKAGMRKRVSSSHFVSVLFPRDRIQEMPRRGFWGGLSLVWSQVETRPTLVFILLSVAFGAAISVVVPPLRGPDEIAHFLRIYSYARGELLPTAEVDGRKGIFIGH